MLKKTKLWRLMVPTYSCAKVAIPLVSFLLLITTSTEVNAAKHSKISLDNGHILVPKVYTQLRKITGRVTNVENSPLANVSVTVKGTNLGTVTDFEGKFMLEVPSQNSIIQCSSIGFNVQELSTHGVTELAITLIAENQALDEVIVVGYGTQKKINLTGAVSQISGDEIKRIPSNNLTNTLGGRVAGISAISGNGRPGSGTSLQVRGLSSLNDNSPLVVVDGVVRTDGFGNIDPNEVESLTVLKDASSAAVYGARAANGVILITTKKGKEGKPSITYTGFLGSQSPTLYPKLMSAFEYATIRNQALLNQGYEPSNPIHSSMFYSEKDLAHYRDNSTDWYQETFKKSSLQQHHNLSAAGGTEALRFFTSLGTFDQQGMYEHIDFKRYNFRTNVDAKINKNLNFGMYIDGRQENNRTPGWDANEIFHRVVVTPPVKTAYHPSGRPANTTGSHPGEMIRSSGYNRDQTSIFSGTATIDHKLPFIVEGLSFKLNGSYFKSNQFLKSFILPYTMYDEDSQGNITSEKMVGGRSALRELYQEIVNSSYNLSLNYQNTFGFHNISGLALYEEFRSNGNTFNARKEDFATNLKEEFYASGPKNQTIDGNSLLFDARRSFVGRINYAYNSKYLFEATFRYDGSFRFPKDKRYGLFPAISMGWNISHEDFFKNSGLSNSINHFKLRISKGLIGNDRINPFQFMESFSLISGQGPVINGQPVSSATYGKMPNPLITWEKQDNNNIGLELAMFNSKLTLEADYFIRITKDILWSRDRLIPGTFGRDLSDENYARVKSNGIDLSLNYRDQINDLKFNIKLIGNYATNKVTEIDDPSNAFDYEKQLGRPMGFMVGYKTDGLFRTQEEASIWGNGYQFGQKNMPGDIRYVDLDNDGEITLKDQGVISKYGAMPRIMYGLNLGLNYKNFDVNILFQGAALRKTMLSSNARVLFLNGGNSNNFSYMNDSWSVDNPDAAYPQSWLDSRLVNNRNSDFWLRKSDFLRLKSADIGFTLNDSKWLKNRGLGAARIYLSGFNLLTFSSFKEFDPEAESGAGYYYPQQQTFNIGINLTF